MKQMFVLKEIVTFETCIAKTESSDMCATVSENMYSSTCKTDSTFRGCRYNERGAIEQTEEKCGVTPAEKTEKVSG